MQKITLITTLSVLALAACSPQAPEPAVSAPVAETPAAPAMADMPMAAEPQAAAGPITSMGKIIAIDAAVGTVTLDHQAIPVAAALPHRGHYDAVVAERIVQ